MRNRKSVFVAIAIAALLAEPLMYAQLPAPAREDSLLSAAQRAIDNEASSGLRVVESKALKLPDADAIRKGDSLLLELNSGTTRTFRNRPECNQEARETSCQEYFLVVHASSRHAFIVAKLYYESLEFLVVDDATGEETTLRGLPAFSPSGNHLVVLLSNDAQIGFAVQIWSREEHRFVLKWTGSPYTDGIYTTYKLLNWSSDTAAKFEAKTDFIPPKRSSVNTFEVRCSITGWKIVNAH